jgi:hypothetical protein
MEMVAKVNVVGKGRSRKGALSKLQSFNNPGNVVDAPSSVGKSRARRSRPTLTHASSPEVRCRSQRCKTLFALYRSVVRNKCNNLRIQAGSPRLSSPEEQQPLSFNVVAVAPLPSLRSELFLID